MTSEKINMRVVHTNTCRQSVAGCGNMPDTCLRDSTGSLVARMEQHKGSCGQGEDSGFSSEKTGESLYCFEQKNDMI